MRLVGHWKAQLRRLQTVAASLFQRRLAVYTTAHRYIMYYWLYYHSVPGRTIQPAISPAPSPNHNTTNCKTNAPAHVRNAT